MIKIMRVTGDRLAAGGSKFHRFGLPENKGPRMSQGHDACRIERGMMAQITGRVVLRRHVNGVNHVLHSDGDAMERSPFGPFVELTRLPERLGRVKETP